MLWSRLIPLFPQHLPPYFRIELVDASNRVIHAAGGDISGKETAEPVLIMPFSELLLPNAQIRASLIPERLPLGSFRLAVWLGISAPILVILLAGLLIYRMLRRELRLSGQKTGFVSQVSHELKTPLTSIRMYAELLRDHDRPDGAAISRSSSTRANGFPAWSAMSSTSAASMQAANAIRRRKPISPSC